MAETKALIEQVYADFNRRDIDGVFAWMSERVNWPMSSEGDGRAVGKDAVRAYWTRQWAEIDPRVEPVAVSERADGKTEVRAHQVVRSLQGEVLLDQMVVHVYAIVDGLIERMDIEESGAAAG
jgi:hypothetical protein